MKKFNYQRQNSSQTCELTEFFLMGFRRTPEMAPKTTLLALRDSLKPGTGTGTGMKTLKPGTGTGTSPGTGIKSHEIENLALLVYLFEANGKNVIT